MGNLRLMIVDDNIAIRRILRILCTPFAKDILECTDGTEAVKNFSDFHPDVTLMDLEMKGMDGITATRSLKQREPGSFVIIVTNYSDDTFRKAASNAGADAFFSKEKLEDLVTFLEGIAHKVGLIS